MRARLSLLATLSILAVPLAAVPGLAAPADPRDATPDAEPAPLVEGIEADVHLGGMTFVASRGAKGQVTLLAARATFQPETRTAELEQVQVDALDDARARRFDVRCDRGELDIESNDFLAEGNVLGHTGEGQRYRSAWVRYDHDEQLLFTDAPVIVDDTTGTFRGDGFRYHLDERRFELLGNVSVVHSP